MIMIQLIRIKTWTIYLNKRGVIDGCQNFLGETIHRDQSRYRSRY